MYFTDRHDSDITSHHADFVMLAISQLRMLQSTIYLAADQKLLGIAYKMIFQTLFIVLNLKQV